MLAPLQIEKFLTWANMVITLKYKSFPKAVPDTQQQWRNAAKWLRYTDNWCMSFHSELVIIDVRKCTFGEDFGNVHKSAGFSKPWRKTFSFASQSCKS